MNGAYNWDFSVVWEYQDMLARAAVLTLGVAAGTIACGVVFGLLLAMLRLSRLRTLAAVVMMVIEVLRAVPPVVLVVWIYYCMPILTGWSLNAVQTSIMALALYSGAFYAEIFRAGIQSVSRGHLEAAYACGMTRFRTMTRITAPLAFQSVLPPFISQCVLVVKNTSLASFIAVPEIVYQGQRLSIQTFRPLEILTSIAVIFIALIIPLTLLANLAEARIRRKYYA
ncbi:amino acid ABC transporter permease [Roseomonas sp. E05]|uniref:amino acid ABC transporter permease n=1 Tax=Roseomonas sp. E05 TaxID=3046310 RepID=UPI0024B8C62F|nr:amino acid ABC transporter permease [Roseomonas sp. E05]MDJ0391049.1 amino acid ABC transporter permease [Roseomonas sp. E05]